MWAASELFQSPGRNWLYPLHITLFLRARVPLVCLNRLFLRQSKIPTSTGSLFKFRNSQVYWRRKLLGNDFLEQGDKNASLMSASYVVLLALFSSSSLGHPVIFCQLGVTNKCSWLQVSIGSFLTTPTPRGTLPSRYLMHPDDIPQTSLSGVFVSSLAKPSAFI